QYTLHLAPTAPSTSAFLFLPTRTRPPPSPLFPYTTLFRSDNDGKFDTLEVETRNLRVPRLFDQTGIMFHPDGQAIIKERIYQDKDRKSTRLNSSHVAISYAVFCLKKKT